MSMEELRRSRTSELELILIEKLSASELREQRLIGLLTDLSGDHKDLLTRVAQLERQLVELFDLFRK